MEFLIKTVDGQWFNLKPGDFAKACHPNSVAYEVSDGWGDHCIAVAGTEISFSYEDPGVQVSFDDDTMGEVQAMQIVTEIAGNLTEATGQASRVVRV